MMLFWASTSNKFSAVAQTELGAYPESPPRPLNLQSAAIGGSEMGK